MELQRELHTPRIAHGAGDLAEGVQVRRAAGRRAEAGMIAEVEKFGAEIEVAHFVQAEFFADAEIPIGVTGRARDADAGIAELAAGCIFEGTRIQPTVNRLSGGRGIADQQRTPLRRDAAADAASASEA